LPVRYQEPNNEPVRQESSVAHRKAHRASVHSAKEKGGNHASALADRAFDLMSFLVRAGWTPEGAAIAAGNAEQESGIRPDGPMGDASVPGGSLGMFQWNRARLVCLKESAAARHLDWRSKEAQYEFFVSEAERMLPDWKAQTSLDRAGFISRTYEGYGDASTETRVNNASKWLRAYRERVAAKSPTPNRDTKNPIHSAEG
jgi:hypothetical protein